MSEPVKNPFEPFFEEVRRIVREEIRAASGNGHKSPEKLLDAKAVAELLGESERWVYQQAKAKKIPSIRLGKYWKFSPSDLQKWIERQRTS